MYHIFQSLNTYYYNSIEHLYVLLNDFKYVDDTEFRQKYIETVKNNWKKIFKS